MSPFPPLPKRTFPSSRKRASPAPPAFSANESDGKTVLSFRVAPAAIIKDFKNDAAIVIDVTGPAAPAKEPEAKPPEPKPQKRPAAADRPTTNAGAGAGQPKPEDHPAAAPPTRKNRPRARPNAGPTPVKEQPSKEQPQAAPERSKAPAAFVLSGNEPELLATFDPRIETGAVVFQRAGQGYIAFDRKITIAPAEITKGSKPRLPIVLVDNPTSGIYSFPIPDNITLRTARDGTAWRVLASQGAVTVFTSRRRFSLNRNLHWARGCCCRQRPADPVKFRNRFRGRYPLARPDQRSRRFDALRRVIFAILPSNQGLVVKPFHQTCRPRCLRRH